MGTKREKIEWKGKPFQNNSVEIAQYDDDDDLITLEQGWGISSDVIEIPVGKVAELIEKLSHFLPE